ncbi:MAG: hypothetical protein MI807_16295 [Verrucomicrobiales bacterium]|nr:hypothetical protein [Verrucomicrobiales bacterium]
MKFDLRLLLMALMSASLSLSIGQDKPASPAPKNDSEWLALANRNLDELIESLPPAEKARVTEARQAKSPDTSRITGTFYGKDESDANLQIVWTIVRDPEGTAALQELHLYHDTKEFERIDDRYRWILIGRLLVEIFPDEPDFINVQMLDEIDEEKISYYAVDPDVPSDEWFYDTDLREKIEFPSIPEGYEKIE